MKSDHETDSEQEDDEVDEEDKMGDIFVGKDGTEQGKIPKRSKFARTPTSIIVSIMLFITDFSK